MDKLRFLFCVGLALITSLPAQAEEFSYAKNTFISYWNCLAIYPGSSLEVNEKVWIFSENESPVIGKVSHVISSVDARKQALEFGVDKVMSDKSLWDGCTHLFRGEQTESLAQVTPKPESENSLVGLVIRGLPQNAWISSGKGASVSMRVKDNPYIKSVRHLVNKACFTANSLTRIKRFPIREGREIIQLDIGKAKKVSPQKRRRNIAEAMRQAENNYEKWAWPEYKERKLKELEEKEFIESVEICRFFLDGKRVLKAEKISRRTGVDERVDTPTDLYPDNWADTTISVLGFISLNEGKNWDVLRVNEGFEGMLYSIEQLDGSIIHYSFDLYTPH